MISIAEAGVEISCKRCGGLVDQAGCSPKSPRLTCHDCRLMLRSAWRTTAVVYCKNCGKARPRGQGRFTPQFCAGKACRREYSYKTRPECAKCGRKREVVNKETGECKSCENSVRIQQSKISRNCESCGAVFEKQARSKIKKCAECRGADSKRRSDEKRRAKAAIACVPGVIHRSDITGQMGERQFEFACLRCGIPCYAPVFDKNPRIDRVVQIGDQMIGVQVKSTCGPTARLFHETQQYASKSCDAFAIADVPEGEVYLASVSELESLGLMRQTVRVSDVRSAGLIVTQDRFAEVRSKVNQTHRLAGQVNDEPTPADDPPEVVFLQ